MRKLALILALILLFSACAKTGAPSAPEESSGSEKPEENNFYLSISYMHNASGENGTRNKTFYTFDTVTKELKEECTISVNSGEIDGIVSRSDNTVYYSWATDEHEPEYLGNLFAYDIASGESELLEKEDFVYDVAALIDSKTLLVNSVRNDSQIMPALFDLKRRSFTYICDVNGFPPDTYSSAPVPLIYNSDLHSFAYVYKNDSEARSSDYTFESGKEVDTVIALVSDDLVIKPEKTYKIGLKFGQTVLSAVMVSESNVVFQEQENAVNSENGEIDTNICAHSLVFEDNAFETAPADMPCPYSSDISNCITVDGGKTWYFITDYGQNVEYGLYSYVPETEELTPILLTRDGSSAIIKFTIVKQ